MATDVVPEKLVKSRTRSIVLNAGLTAVAFGLLAWTVWRNWDKLREVIARRPSLGVLGVGLLIYLASLLITFYRWYNLVRALDLPFRLRDAIRLGFIGNVFNLVIPGAVGGDVIKAAFLCREQERKTQAVASMVIDRVVGLLGLFVLAGLVGAFAWSAGSPLARRLILMAWVLTLAGLAGLAVLFTPTLYRPLLSLFAGRGKLETILNELVKMADAYRRKLGVVALAVVTATIGHALYVCAFFCASKSLFHGDAPGLLAHFQVVPLTLLSTAVPLPFGALGLSENLSETLFRSLDGFGGGAIAMFGYRAIMYAGGLISVFFYLANLRQVRTLKSA